MKLGRCLRGFAWAGALAAATGAWAGGRVTVHNRSGTDLLVGWEGPAAPEFEVLGCPRPGACVAHARGSGGTCWLPREHTIAFRLDDLEGDLDADLEIRDLDWHQHLNLLGLTIHPLAF